MRRTQRCVAIEPVDATSRDSDTTILTGEDDRVGGIVSKSAVGDTSDYEVGKWKLRE